MTFNEDSKVKIPSILHLARLGYPPGKMVKRFEKLVCSKYDAIALHRKENQQRTALRDWLLPMLMNGQVQVH